MYPPTSVFVLDHRCRSTRDPALKQRSQVLCGCTSRSVGAARDLPTGDTRLLCTTPAPAAGFSLQDNGHERTFSRGRRALLKGPSVQMGRGAGEVGVAGSLGGGAPPFADSDEAFLGSAAFSLPTKKPAKGLPWRSSG